MSTMSKSKAEEILGLTGTYDSKKLRDAYRKLAAENHPDAVSARGGDVQTADAKMKEINAANAFLQVLVKKNVTLTAGLEPGTDKPAYTVYSSKNAGSAAQQPTGQTYSTKQGTATAQPSGKPRWAAYTAAGQNEPRAEKTSKWTAAAQSSAATTVPNDPVTTASAGAFKPRTKTSDSGTSPKYTPTLVHILNIIDKVIDYIPLRPLIVWLMFSNLYTWQVSSHLWDNFLGWNIEIQQYISGNPFLDIPLGLVIGLLCLVELATGVITKIIKACLKGLVNVIGIAVAMATSK